MPRLNSSCSHRLYLPVSEAPHTQLAPSSASSPTKPALVSSVPPLSGSTTCPLSKTAHPCHLDLSLTSSPLSDSHSRTPCAPTKPDLLFPSTPWASHAACKAASTTKLLFSHKSPSQCHLLRDAFPQLPREGWLPTSAPQSQGVFEQTSTTHCPCCQAAGPSQPGASSFRRG